MKDMVLYPPMSDRICPITGADKEMRTKEVDDERGNIGHNQYVFLAMPPRELMLHVEQRLVRSADDPIAREL